MGGPEGLATFDGIWVDEDGATIQVKDGHMQGPDAEPMPLVMTGPGICSFHLDGQVFVGRLEQNGELLAWSDGVEWTRRAEEQALDFEEATKLGGTLRVNPDEELVFRECHEAGLDDAAGAPLRRAAVGRFVTVLASDPIDRTLECRVPRVGDVWLPFAALLRVQEGEAAELEPLGEEQPLGARNSEDPSQQSEPWTGWEWERPGEPPPDVDVAAPAIPVREKKREEPAVSAARRWFVQRSERLWQELRELETKEPGEQRRQLRALQLELHPDKQPVELRSQAQQLFLIVQCEWESAQKVAAEKKQEEERLRREEEERQVREAAVSQRQNAPQRQWEDQQTRERQRMQEEHRRRVQTQHRQPTARRDPHEEDSEPEEPDDPREDTSRWDEARYKEAAAAFKSRENLRLRREDEIRRKSRRMTHAGVPGDPRTSPVEVRVIDPTSEEYVTGRPLYTFKSAKRSWLICDVKEEIERVGRIDRLSQRLSVTSITETQITTENELEDGDSLSELPAGPVLSLTLFVAPQMYDDYAYLLKGVQKNWRMLQWAPLALRSDRLIIRTAMRQSWQALKHASRELRGDRALVLKAVKQDGAALEFAAGRLPADRALVLPAVRRNWRALQYSSTEMRADPELVLRAMRQDLQALQHAAPELLDCRDFLLRAVAENPSALYYASFRMKADRLLLLEAVQRDPWALQHAAPKLKADRELVLKAVRQDPGVLEHAAPMVRSDRMILTACKGNWEALKHVDEEHKVTAEADLWKASYSPHFDMAAYRAKLFGGKPPPNLFKR